MRNPYSYFNKNARNLVQLQVSEKHKGLIELVKDEGAKEYPLWLNLDIVTS